MATTETSVPARLYEMPLADLQADPNQPRKYLDPVALDELTESVKQQSVIAPILFRVENGIAYVNARENRETSRKSWRVSLPLLVVPFVQPMTDQPDGPPQPEFWVEKVVSETFQVITTPKSVFLSKMDKKSRLQKKSRGE